MEEAIKILKKNVIPKSTIVVAVSGGPDSMALLNIILQLRKELDLKIICAHVNHNSGRVGQNDDQLFVESYCCKNNIKFEVMKIEKYEHKNFHEEAHNKRYDYFDSLIKKYNAKYLLTAHHGDDLMETILMRIVRGSTLKGYSGFSPIVNKEYYTILRPLINFTKEDIVNYNKKNNIEFVIDTSNKKDVYTRNRFRKYILPLLKVENKNVHNKFYKFSKIISECNMYIDKQTKIIMKDLYKNKTLNIVEFQNQEKIIQNKILDNIFEDLYKDNLMLITDKHIELVYGVINCKKANTYADLPNKIKVIKRYNELIFETNIIKEKYYEYELKDNILLPNNKHIEYLKDTSENTNYICRINSKDVRLPLKVRNRVNGDVIQIKGMVGHKKINDIFINAKINMEDRNVWPIVLDSNNNVVWIPGLKKSKFDKPKDEKCDIILRYY